MKLLALEARQNSFYYLSRYQQVVEFGGDLHVLNGEGEPGYWPVGKYRIAGSKKIDDIIEAARAWHEEENFEGVLTFSESAVTSVAAVATALGLPSIGFEAARASRNKLIMRQAHEKEGVPIPRFRFVEDLAQARAAAEAFGYPVILKPTLGAASNFVFRIDNPEQLEERWPVAVEGIKDMTWYQMEADGLDLGPAGLLIESFLDGRECLTEATVWDGELFIGSITDRVTVESDTFDDDVHHAPAALDPRQIAEVHEVIAAGARAQGLRRSVLHAEIRFHQGKPHLLEIAVRPGGGGLDIIARIVGAHDPIRAVMAVATGRRPDTLHPYSPTGKHVAAMCLVSGAGTVVKVNVPEHVSNDPRVFLLKITAKPGDVIRRPPHGNNILGFLGVTGDSYEESMATMNDLAAQITAELS